MVERPAAPANRHVDAVHLTRHHSRTVMRGWLLGELALRLERIGYACLRVAKRVEVRAINAQTRTGQPTDGPGQQSESELSGSPATGESGGRRCESRALAFEPRHNMRVALDMFGSAPIKPDGTYHSLT